MRVRQLILTIRHQLDKSYLGIRAAVCNYYFTAVKLYNSRFTTRNIFISEKVSCFVHVNYRAHFKMADRASADSEGRGLFKNHKTYRVP